MTDHKIKRYYKILSLITLALSIISIFLDLKEEIMDKILNAVMINIVFHAAYHFISKMPLGIYQNIKKENEGKTGLITKMSSFSYFLFKTFAIMIMLISVIGTGLFLKSVFAEQQYEQLVILTIFGALFLAGYKLRIQLKKNKNALQQ